MKWSQEASPVQMKSALGGIPVARAMLTDFRPLAPADRISRAIELILAGSQQDFPVVDGDRVVGVLTRGDLLRALPARGPDVVVSEVMQRQFQVVDSSDMLESAMLGLQECACHTIPVQHGGRVVGLLTMDNVGEFVAIQAALGGARG